MSAAPATTSQTLAAFDAARRDAATASGAPLDRSTHPGLCLDVSPTPVIYIGTDEKIRVLDLDDTSLSAPLRPVVLHDLVAGAVDPDTDDSPFLFASTETLRRTVRYAARLARSERNDRAWATARLLEYRAGLPMSTLMPVLTEALASRYWLPSGADEDDLHSWDRAFGHGYRTGTHDAFDFLITRASTGVRNDRLVKAFAGAERYGLLSARSGAGHTQCSAFGQAGTAMEAYTALVATDPLLRERNQAAGLLTEILVTSVTDVSVVARIVGEPGRLREGAVSVFSDEGPGLCADVTLRQVDADASGLVMTIGLPKRKRIPASLLVPDATLYVTQAPFLMRRRAPANRRWTNGNKHTLAGRDIPTDIASAGGPQA